MATSKATKATTMAELLKKASATFVSPKKGAILPGTITKLTSSEILVDIGAKTEALVLEKDRENMRTILATLKVGDKVDVSVLNPESDFGNPVVSLRRYIDEKLWNKVSSLQKGKSQLDAIVLEETRGGFLVKTDEGITGFLPNSHTLGNLSIGKSTKVSLLEFDRLAHKIIFSQKKNVSTVEFENSTKNLKTDQKISATITSIAPFGIFVSIETSKDNFAEGFVHISEISWEKLETVPEDYKVGDKIEALILSFDKKSARINLSIKRLTADPYKEKLKEYTADKKVKGTVSKVLSSGVAVSLEDGIEGFIKKDKIPVGAKYEIGSSISATVTEVDEKNHRVLLSLYLAEKPIGYR